MMKGSWIRSSQAGWVTTSAVPKRKAAPLAAYGNDSIEIGPFSQLSYFLTSRPILTQLCHTAGDNRFTGLSWLALEIQPVVALPLSGTTSRRDLTLAILYVEAFGLDR